jgi:ribokinase
LVVQFMQVVSALDEHLVGARARIIRRHHAGLARLAFLQAQVPRLPPVGVRVFLDPAPAVKLPDDLFPCIDVIKPNETEASIITGMSVCDPESARSAGRWLIERGVGQVIITLGDKGAVLCSGKDSRHFRAPSVNAIDSTGAGDIFSGALLAALAEGKETEAAIDFANHAAALSATRLGVIESIPTRAEVDAFIGGGARS